MVVCFNVPEVAVTVTVCPRACPWVVVAEVAWSCRRRTKLLQRHSYVNRVKKRARLTVDLQNGAARNRLTRSR